MAEAEAEVDGAEGAANPSDVRLVGGSGGGCDCDGDAGDPAPLCLRFGSIDPRCLSMYHATPSEIKIKMRTSALIWYGLATPTRRIAEEQHPLVHGGRLVKVHKQTNRVHRTASLAAANPF